MSLGAAVDVVVGLMLGYLLLGLIGSALLEALAGWFNFRGWLLKQALQQLLSHDAAPDTPADALFAQVYRHGLIAPRMHGRAPSYVAPAGFSGALFDVLCAGEPPTVARLQAALSQWPAGPAAQSLHALLVQAGDDVAAFRVGVERWFEHAMDRTSGRYKRLSNNIMLAFGLVVALGGNIDSAAIAKALWADARPVIATPMVASTPMPAGTAATAAPARPALPLGWRDEGPHEWTLEKLIGCLVTALAVSVGAPFWFDTLQKFLRVRSAGPKPPSA